MNDKPYDENDKKNILSKVRNNIEDADMVIVNDFGHGFIFSELIDLISKKGNLLQLIHKQMR